MAGLWSMGHLLNVQALTAQGSCCPLQCLLLWFLGASAAHWLPSYTLKRSRPIQEERPLVMSALSGQR